MKDLLKNSTIFSKYDNEQLLCTQRLAALMGVSTQWLEIARSKGGGPPFIRLSPRMVRYRVSDVTEWLNQRAHNSTSEYQAGGSHD